MEKIQFNIKKLVSIITYNFITSHRISMELGGLLG